MHHHLRISLSPRCMYHVLHVHVPWSENALGSKLATICLQQIDPSFALLDPTSMIRDRSISLPWLLQRQRIHRNENGTRLAILRRLC